MFFSHLSLHNKLSIIINKDAVMFCTWGSVLITFFLHELGTWREESIRPAFVRKYAELDGK